MKVFTMSLSALFASVAAHASDDSQKVEVYRIVSVASEDSAGWTKLVTTSGLNVFTRCSRAQFDDPIHDRVGGFKSAQACTTPLELLKNSASPEHPVGMQIGPEFVVLLHQEM